MKIKVGKYTLYSDSMCMWITEKYAKEHGKNAGETDERRVAGYSTSLTNLLRSFRDAKIGGSDAETVEELIEVMKATYEDMIAFKDAAVAEDFNLIKEKAKGKD